MLSGVHLPAGKSDVSKLVDGGWRYKFLCGFGGVGYSIHNPEDGSCISDISTAGVWDAARLTDSLLLLSWRGSLKSQHARFLDLDTLTLSPFCEVPDAWSSTRGVCRIQVNSSEPVLAAGSGDGSHNSALIWSVETGKEGELIHTLADEKHAAEKRIVDVLWSDAHRRIFTLSGAGVVRSWDAGSDFRSMTVVAKGVVGGRSEHMGCDEERDILVCPGRHFIRFYDLNVDCHTGFKDLPVEGQLPQSMKVFHSRYLVVGTQTGKLYNFDMRMLDSGEVWTSQAHGGCMHPRPVMVTDDTFATSSNDGDIKIWDFLGNSQSMWSGRRDAKRSVSCFALLYLGDFDDSEDDVKEREECFEYLLSNEFALQDSVRLNLLGSSLFCWRSLIVCGDSAVQ